MGTITKKKLLYRGFQEVWKGGYRLEGKTEEYEYCIVIWARGVPQCHPRLYRIEITKTSKLHLDAKNPNTWDSHFQMNVIYEEDIDKLLKFAGIKWN